MSLINQMLQDLETRPGAQGSAAGMHRDVRASGEPTARRSLVGLLVALLVLVAVGAGGYRAWQRFSAIEPLPSLSPELSLQISAALLSMEPLQGAAAAPEAPLPLVSAPGMPPPAADVAVPPVGMMPKPAPVPPAVEPIVPAPSTRDRGNPTPPVAAASGNPAPVERAPVPERAKPKEATPRQLAEVEYRRGIALAQQGRSAESIPLFERALELDASYADARHSLVTQLMEAKNIDGAIQRLQEGLVANRADGAMAMMLARIQIDRGQTNAAIDTLSRSLPYDRDRADYHAFMAGLLQKEGRHREAIDYYLNALRKVPRNAVWWMGIGISLQAEKRNAEARDAFSRADSIGGMSADLQAFVRQRLEQLR
ncbi:MAG: tetratricopeptide repeat protein [Lacisediminimonas sp.]|nr:tetratricopeptide repeat protein [Lacisediminimonas sp.]